MMTQRKRKSQRKDKRPQREFELKNQRSTAASRPSYSLDELLAGITPENCHAEIDFGPPVGKEI